LGEMEPRQRANQHAVDFGSRNTSATHRAADQFVETPGICRKSRYPIAIGLTLWRLV
jgi:hypothetical protein